MHSSIYTTSMFAFLIVLILGLGAVAYGAPSRIVGGHDAPNHKFPYQVSLQDRIMGHFCSGSILNEHWILTAGHCVKDSDPKNYIISVGTNYLNVSGDTYKPQFSVLHEKYVHFYFDDIALIRIDGKIFFNDFVRPIVLPNEEVSDYSIPATIAGWGKLWTNGPIPNELQEIDLKLVTIDACKEIQTLTTPNHICTFTKAGEGICNGDSGGPLVAGGVQIGIASYVVPCAVGYPDVYTRVLPYRDWIDTTMQRYRFISE